MRLIDADKFLSQIEDQYMEHDLTRSEYMDLEDRRLQQPTVEPERHWIPVSERLPEIGKEVLLSEPNVMFIAEYHGAGDPEGLWLVDRLHHYLADVNGCAWMPLPEPWEGEKE